jgi:transposase
MDRTAYLDFVLEIIHRREGARNLEVLPRQWVVERTFGWMTRWRRLIRNYERRIGV